VAAGSPSQAFKGRRPNFLILMVDEMRYPLIYESAATKAFRQQYLLTQNLLRQHGVEFHRHYAASVACSPSRGSLYTGHYPSLHGVTQTTGAAKEAFDPTVLARSEQCADVRRLLPCRGYRTFCEASGMPPTPTCWFPHARAAAQLRLQHGSARSAAESLYQSSDRLDRYGFGLIGPEPHGKAPLNSGSSVPPGQQGCDAISPRGPETSPLDHDNSAKLLIVSSFVNPHDITLWGLWVNTGQAGDFDFYLEPGVVPVDLFDPVLFQQTVNDDLATKPSAQASYQASYAKWLQPILEDPATLEQYYRTITTHKNVDEQMMTVLQTLLGSRFKDTIVIFTSDHGDLLGALRDASEVVHGSRKDPGS
jgi:choline-sulfatase